MDGTQGGGMGTAMERFVSTSSTLTATHAPRRVVWVCACLYTGSLLLVHVLMRRGGQLQHLLLLRLRALLWRHAGVRSSSYLTNALFWCIALATVGTFAFISLAAKPLPVARARRSPRLAATLPATTSRRRDSTESVMTRR